MRREVMNSPMWFVMSGWIIPARTRLGAPATSAVAHRPLHDGTTSPASQGGSVSTPLTRPLRARRPLSQWERHGPSTHQDHEVDERRAQRHRGGAGARDGGGAPRRHVARAGDDLYVRAAYGPGNLPHRACRDRPDMAVKARSPR